MLGFARPVFNRSTLVSLFFVCFCHFGLAMVPLFLPSFSILSMLSISALLLVAVSAFGRCCRALLRVSASAPALVIFNVLFIWGVHIASIREEISSLKNAVITLEFALVMIGLYSILSGDPGIVKHNNSCLDTLNQNSVSNPQNEDEELLTSHVSVSLGESAIDVNTHLPRRVRYCDSCKAYIRGFDHHCPAFGNCIGQKNLLLFMVLLIGFIILEASYIACASQYLMRSWYEKLRLESDLSTNLVTSTMLFSILQLLWQINWKKYPEFQVVDHPQPGQHFPEVTFRNPYDKGVIVNIKEFLQLK